MLPCCGRQGPFRYRGRAGQILARLVALTKQILQVLRTDVYHITALAALFKLGITPEATVGHVDGVSADTFFDELSFVLVQLSRPAVHLVTQPTRRQCNCTTS